VLLALLNFGMDQEECYQFVVENKGNKVFIRMKGTQGCSPCAMDNLEYPKLHKESLGILASICAITKVSIPIKSTFQQ